MRSPRTAVFALAAVASAGCGGGATACAAGLTCGDARWLDGLVAVDGRFVTAPASALAVPGAPLSVAQGDALPVSSRRAYLRFDTGAFAGAVGVERAVLSLAPHPRWRPDADAELLVRSVTTPWDAARTASGESVAPVGESTARVGLPSGLRGPVRVDVTALVREWMTGATASGSMALETSRGEAVFVGLGALTRSERPRLEVVLR